MTRSPLRAMLCQICRGTGSYPTVVLHSIFEVAAHWKAQFGRSAWFSYSNTRMGPLHILQCTEEHSSAQLCLALHSVVCLVKELLCCSLGSLPWQGWPKYPPPGEEDGRYEDVMHKLARLVEKSTFTRSPQVSIVSVILSFAGLDSFKRVDDKQFQRKLCNSRLTV